MAIVTKLSQMSRSFLKGVVWWALISWLGPKIACAVRRFLARLPADRQVAGFVWFLARFPADQQVAGFPSHPGQKLNQCQQQSRNQIGVHWSLVPWIEIMDEIKNNCHPFPIREGGLCRAPTCECVGHDDKMEFQGYCCKQCALRWRENCADIIVVMHPHGDHGQFCQGKKCRQPNA